MFDQVTLNTINHAAVIIYNMLVTTCPSARPTDKFGAILISTHPNITNRWPNITRVHINGQNIVTRLFCDIAAEHEINTTNLIAGLTVLKELPLSSTLTKPTHVVLLGAFRAEENLANADYRSCLHCNDAHFRSFPNSLLCLEAIRSHHWINYYAQVPCRHNIHINEQMETYYPHASN